MEEEMDMQESSVLRETTETAAPGNPHAAEGRHGPTWRGWVLSILVSVILSVTATLLLGGYVAFRSDSAIGAGMDSGGSGGERSCCPPADAGK